MCRIFHNSGSFQKIYSIYIWYVPGVKNLLIVVHFFQFSEIKKIGKWGKFRVFHLTVFHLSGTYQNSNKFVKLWQNFWYVLDFGKNMNYSRILLEFLYCGNYEKSGKMFNYSRYFLKSGSFQWKIFFSYLVRSRRNKFSICNIFFSIFRDKKK